MEILGVALMYGLVTLQCFVIRLVYFNHARYFYYCISPQSEDQTKLLVVYIAKV